MLNKQEKGHKKTEYSKTSLWGMAATGLVLLLIMSVLFLVQANVPYSQRDESIRLISKEDIVAAKLGNGTSDNKEYLVLIENGDVASDKANVLLDATLSQMKMNFDVYDVSLFNGTILNNYDNLILAISNYPLISDYLSDLKDWVNNGGNLMVCYPPETSGSFMSLSDLFGIKECGGYALIEEIRCEEGFMVGGDNKNFKIVDAYESSLSLTLSDDCSVFMKSTDEYPVPLMWRRNYGSGSVVFDNFGLMDKAYRGICSAAVSLMGDACAYPVINASTFYIDDFPSPIPEGDGEYINRDYNMSVENFYTQVWWNDVYAMAKEHGIRYTGLVIENYSNQVDGEWERNDDVERYLYFGNMLLSQGGEIGIHGYNHMPLVLSNFDYENRYDEYIQWPGTEDMKNAISEVMDFTNTLYDKEDLQVYVPPSNILSKEGRAVLSELGFKAIASLYIEGDLGYSQEFDVSIEDGMVNTPRVVSGYIFDDFDKLLALSELNFHLVSTHFQHPDDVLDEDRGASLGWKEMSTRLNNYMDWLYGAFPNIRNLTGSELAAAVQRYDVLQVQRKITDQGLNLGLTNYYDEAYMILRLNGGQEIEKITGGSFEKIGNNLYLIEGTSENINIIYK